MISRPSRRVALPTGTLDGVHRCDMTLRWRALRTSPGHLEAGITSHSYSRVSRQISTARNIRSKCIGEISIRRVRVPLPLAHYNNVSGT